MTKSLLEHSIVLILEPPKKSGEVLNMALENSTDFKYLFMKDVFTDLSKYRPVDTERKDEPEPIRQIFGELEFANKVSIKKEPFKFVIEENSKDKTDEIPENNDIDKVAIKIFEKVIKEKYESCYLACGINYVFLISNEKVETPVVDRLLNTNKFFDDLSVFNGGINYSEKLENEETTLNTSISEYEPNSFIIKYNINFNSKFLKKHIDFLESHSAMLDIVNEKNQKIIEFLS